MRRLQANKPSAVPKAVIKAVAPPKVEEKPAPEPELPEPTAERPWLRICVQHWRPRQELTQMIRLLQGERLQVTWTDGNAGGWAYGSTLEDPSVTGYFPQDTLAEVEREARPRAVGEAYGVLQRFDDPEEITGYLGIRPGDTVEVLYPMQKPYVWAYVKLISLAGRDPAAADRGWVPESVLSDTDAVQPAG